MKLAGKAAVVTGGGRGVGRAVALAYAREGADVIVNYVSNDATAREVVAEVEQLGRKARAVKADVSVKAEAEGLVQACVDDFGKI